MLDLKILQKEPSIVAEALKKRSSKIDINEFLILDKERRARLTEVEILKSERNKSSQEVARLKREGVDASSLIESLSSQADRIKFLDLEAEEIVSRENEWLMSVPNCPDASVPYGKDEKDNVEIRRWGTPREFSFSPKEHYEIAADLDLGIDLERGAKIAGARFSVNKGWAARLERAIANFFLDVQTLEFGHTEFTVPLMVNRQTMTGTGQLPKFEEDLFKLDVWDYFLIPTAEVPLTSLHSNEVLEEEDLPLLYTAHTPCFRSEAGSSGKDTKGLIRQHQFSKVEMVHFAHPEHSWPQLEEMRRFAEILLERLELPYRTVALCSGDMGFSSAKTYDLEVWLPGQNTYREISSCSNCTDFQARRANIRFRRKSTNKTEFVHTLNGSGLPVGRTLVAIIENGQEADGSIKIPKVLVPYMNGLEHIYKKK